MNAALASALTTPSSLPSSKHPADCRRFHRGDSQKRAGGPAGAGGVLLPFVQRLGTDAEGLRELHLGQAKGSADIAGFWVGRGGGSGLRQREAILGGNFDTLMGDFRSLLEYLKRIIAMAAIAYQPMNGADE